MNYLIRVMPYPIYVGSLIAIIASMIWFSIKYADKIWTRKGFFFPLGVIVLSLLLIITRTMENFNIFLEQKPAFEIITFIWLFIYIIYVFVTAWPVIRSDRMFYILIIICSVIVLLGIITILVVSVL